MGRTGETEGITRGGAEASNEVDYCRSQDAASAHDLTAAPLFTAEAPSVGTADFDPEEGFRVVADCRFRTMAIVLRRRGSSRRSLATAWRIKQATGSARPQVAHNFALSCRWLSCESGSSSLHPFQTSQTRVCSHELSL